MFRNREDAGRQLAKRLKSRPLRDPLVLAVPRGGVAVGFVLAGELVADFDVVLARKLRAPGQPELALGAINEDGRVYLNPDASRTYRRLAAYLDLECGQQMRRIARRERLFRSVRPRAPVAGRSVIVTDDGIATGATLTAALQTVRAQRPTELIAAVPVAPAGRLPEVRRWCDDVLCLVSPEYLAAVSDFYEDFAPVEDEEAVALLRPFSPAFAR
jgi:predicted phosphoribosyltransferase